MNFSTRETKAVDPKMSLQIRLGLKRKLFLPTFAGQAVLCHVTDKRVPVEGACTCLTIDWAAMDSGQPVYSSGEDSVTVACKLGETH